MKPQLPLYLFIALFSATVTATELPEPIAEPKAAAGLNDSVTTGLPELSDEVAELAQQRLQRKDEVLAAELAEVTADKLQRFAAISD